MGDVESHAVLLPSFVTHAVTHNKKAIRCVWHMIFISAWYYVTFNNVKTDGNFFDIISN